MKRMTYLGGVLVLALPLTCWADSPAKKPADTKPVTVPFELFKTKHIAVMIKINGKGPYRVIFDTGAPVTLLSTKVATQTGLIDKNTPKPLFAPFNTAGEAKIKTLSVGDLQVKDVNAIIMDHPAVEAMSEAFGPVEGIVGFPFFSRYKMTLDYKAQQMTFVPSNYEPADSLEAITAMVFALLQDSAPQVLSPSGQWGLVVSKSTKDEEAGVDIKQVLPDSAAAVGGLKAGDRLLTLDGRWTDSVADTYLAASLIKSGTAVTVVVKRDGKEVTLTVKPAPGL
jgi:hypothetical protein